MKVVVVDDDNIVSMSLKMIIEAAGIEVIATGNSGEEAVELYEKYKPDVLLSDIRMDGMTGIEAAKEIISKHKEAKILFLTTFSDDEYVIDALKYGAKGYILKQDFEGIVPALNAVNSGQSVFGGEIISKIPKITNETEKHNDIETSSFEEKNISEKELSIIKLVAEGMNNKEIAEELYLSEGTVRNYLSNILEKLELRDRTQLVVYYYKALGL
jgi:DNA-binding NarL/FixJ family response regulator